MIKNKIAIKVYDHQIAALNAFLLYHYEFYLI